VLANGAARARATVGEISSALEKVWGRYHAEIRSISGVYGSQFEQDGEWLEMRRQIEDFARTRPEGVVLLIDTYDTEAGARKVVELYPKLKKDGILIRGVRIDSGDLVVMSKKVRCIFDEGGLKDVIILVSGGVNEDVLQVMMREKAPIDGYGIGVSLDVSTDAPALDCAYKLQEYAGIPRRKLSEGKATWPGRKQVWRAYDAQGNMRGDILSVESDQQPGETVIIQVMRGGKRLAPAPTLAQIRERAASELKRLPEPLRRLEDFNYPVTISEALHALAAEADRHNLGR